MFDKLDSVVERFDELEAALATPEIACDPSRSTTMMRERAGLEETVTTYRAWRGVLQEAEAAEQMLREESDADMRALAKEELNELEDQRTTLEAKLKELMVPRDPRDDRNVVLEIRAGTGGEEAALFSGDLLRMYARYAEARGWKLEELSLSEASQGGIKEIIVLIRGHGAYSRFKHESGTHRVQRVPVTESQGRIHTSACTVAVLPEAEEVDVDISPGDLRIDTYRASGAGGQHVNRTDSAVRITHLPSGIVVQCQDERSQHKNRDRAMTLLRTKLFEVESERQHSELAADRKAQVGSGDRSERIRTYNFPQNRITDHRIGLTLYALEQVMMGELDAVVEPLLAAERAARLAAAGME
ncbi:MAG: peptide chain release factor 1 [Deltaproteobacteria bacterium]|nr:peptide chain release factor 1 [Deltaproteobacteria bacterium]